MANVRVKISAFNRLSDGDTRKFSTNVVEKVASQTEVYTDVKKQYDDVVIANTNYIKFLDIWITTEGSNDGRNKREAKKQLVDQLIIFARALETFCKGDETYIENAGMPVVKKRVASQPTTYYEPPTIKDLYALRASGTIFYHLIVKNKEKIKTIGMEYSIDGQKTWVSKGLYALVKNTVDGFPERTQVSFRFYTLDSRNNRSGYSEIVTINVN
jgi:hypothetical protein